MTKVLKDLATSDETALRELRREMMSVMSEVSFNPANVIPDRQEELASFMVNELKSSFEENL